MAHTQLSTPNIRLRNPNALWAVAKRTRMAKAMNTQQPRQALEPFRAEVIHLPPQNQPPKRGWGMTDRPTPRLLCGEKEINTFQDLETARLHVSGLLIKDGCEQ